MILASSSGVAFRSARRARGADLALVLRMLGDLLQGGLPLVRALATVREVAPKNWQQGLDQVMEHVRQGATLSSALVEFPMRIPPLVIGLVQAGEAGAGLPAAVRQAADLAEESANLQAALRGALAYPVILGVSAAASVAFLAGVVLPRFAALLFDLGQTLPTSTRLVIHGAVMVRHGALLLLLAGLLGWVMWAQWISAPSGRQQWHAWLLRVPLLGPVRLAIASAHACTAVAALLDRKVPMPTVLNHASRVAPDAAIAHRLMLVRQDVVRGARLSRALEDHHAATTTLIRLARAGEESGRLAHLLAHGARIEHERALHLVRGAVRILEPLLIVLFGGLIAFVAAALLQAMYSLRPVG